MRLLIPYSPQDLLARVESGMRRLKSPNIYINFDSSNLEYSHVFWKAFSAGIKRPLLFTL